MATTATANAAREQVFCHECQEEWFRDEHGLVCPNESCRSDFVEIIENNNDPRSLGLEFDEDSDDEHFHGHAAAMPFPNPFGLPSRTPGGTTIFRAEGPNYSFVTARTTIHPTVTARGSGGPEEEVIADLFSTMLRNIVGDQYSARARNRAAPAQGADGHRDGGDAMEGVEEHREHAHTHSNPPLGSIGVGLGGARLNPRTPDGSQSGEALHVPDIHTFLTSLFGPPPSGGDDRFPPVLAQLFGVPPQGAGGDYVYSQAELDRIISQLMEQHQGNAPPPAAKEDIEALPKVKVTEAMVNEGIDCAVCKDDLVVDEEITTLPCKHSYHFECVSKWLESHDTCPICRHPITPEDRRSHPPQEHAAPPNITTSGLPFFGLFNPASRPTSGRPPTGTSGAASQSSNQPANGGATDGGSSDGGSPPTSHLPGAFPGDNEGPGSPDSSSSGSNNNNPHGGTARSAFANLFRRSGS